MPKSYFQRDFPQTLPVVQQAGRAAVVSKTLKDVASGMMFSCMREFGGLRMPGGQRICKSFGVAQDKQTQCQKHETTELVECCSTFKIDHQ